MVTLDVTKRLRGEVGSTVTVVSQDGCYCLGQYWTVSLDYLVVAKPNTSEVPGQLIAANVCNGTGPAAESRPAIKALQKAPKAPRR